MCVGWNLNKWFHHISPTILYLSFFSAKLLHFTKNVANCQNTLDSAHTEVEDPTRMNTSDVYDRCGHDTRQLHPSCTACRRTANLPGLAWQNEACSQPHHSNHLAKWKRNILADTKFIISIGQTDLGMRQLYCRLGSRVRLFVTSNTSLVSYPTQNVFIVKN